MIAPRRVGASPMRFWRRERQTQPRMLASVLMVAASGNHPVVNAEHLWFGNSIHREVAFCERSHPGGTLPQQPVEAQDSVAALASLHGAECSGAAGRVFRTTRCLSTSLRRYASEPRGMIILGQQLREVAEILTKRHP